MTARGELDAAGIVDPALRLGYLRCRASNARHGRTYFLATLLLPPERRPYVHALYGFARHADDIVDGFDSGFDSGLDSGFDGEGGSAGDRRSRFESWSANVLHDLRWGTTSDPITRALLDTVTRWDIPLTYVADFLESMRLDLTVSGYQTFDDLARYMWGSAAVIGLEMLPLLGTADPNVDGEQLERCAADLGFAFQLTNFVRDVAEDLRRGRVYLPQESLDLFGVDRARLARGVADGPVRNLLAAEIERARTYYRAAAPGIELVHPSSQDCLRTAYTLYGEILDEIERADYDVFSRRVRVGVWRRAVVGAGGALAARRISRRPSHTQVDSVTSTIAKPNSRSSTGA